MGKDHHKETSEAESSSIGDCSSDYAGSSSSSETVEVTSSSSLSFGFSSSSFSSACESSASHPDNGDRGPLFELSDLMDHLPIKRGLSKFYDGKSQSFTSLSSVRSIEDLAKAERPSQKRLKPIRRYLKDLDAPHNSPMPGTPKSARSVNTPDSRIFSSRFSKRTKAKKRRPSSLGIQN